MVLSSDDFGTKKHDDSAGRAEANASKNLEVLDELEKIENIILKQNEILEKYVPAESEDRKSGIEPLSTFEENLSGAFERMHLTLKRHVSAEKAVLNRLENLERQIDRRRSVADEFRLERDILQHRLLEYLKIISSLKCRLEKERCRICRDCAKGRFDGSNADVTNAAEMKKSDSETEQVMKLTKRGLFLRELGIGNWTDKVEDFLDGKHEIKSVKIGKKRKKLNANSIKFPFLPLKKESDEELSLQKAFSLPALTSSSADEKTLVLNLRSHLSDSHLTKSIVENFERKKNSFFEFFVKSGNGNEREADEGDDGEGRSRSRRLKALKSDLAAASQRLAVLKEELREAVFRVVVHRR